MRAVDFCGGWTYRHLDGDETPKEVTVPHDAMLSEPRHERAAGGKNIGWFEGRDYLYEKRFFLTDELKDKVLLLEFEGVYRNAEVRLNGEKLAFRPYGYTNFYVDLSGRLLEREENVLRVIARNSDQPNSRWYSGAGIYRPVTLWTADAAHIGVNGVRIRTVSIEPKAVEISVKTTGRGSVTVQILDGENLLWTQSASSDGCAVFTAELKNAELWDIDSPKLYTCRAAFGTDEYECAFGVRSVEWGENGFLLNGRRVILQGACVHHDHGILGACCYPEAEERRVRLLKENGYNAIRSAHNPCSKALLDACDRMGMLVMDEYIDHWYIHKTEYDYVPYFDAWWRQDLSDMVDKDYNHPSVIMYSIGNEVSETAQKKGIELTRRMTEHLHSLDDTRPVTCGVNIFFNFLSSIGFGVYSDKKAAKEAAQAKNKSKPQRKKAVGSQFFNDMAGILGDEFMKRGATLHGCDVKTRDAFAAMDIAGYNYGIYRYEHDLRKYPHRLILGSETFCNDAYRFRELAKKEPRLIGDFVWAGMDYLGEVGVGSWEYRDYAPQFEGLGWISAGSGRIDLTGKPLGEALYTRIALEKENGVYIAVRPVQFEGQKHSPSAWKMTDAMPSWSWRGCEGRTAHVEVYARAAQTELYLNGRLIGRKRLKGDCQVHFKVKYESGELEARVYDEQGRQIGSRTLTSAGQTAQIILDAEEAAARAGRLCYVRLRYADRDGITTPMARGRIHVDVKGARLLALGSACPFYPESYLDPDTDTYWGEALAVVMPDGSGDVELGADDGTYCGRIIIPLSR